MDRVNSETQDETLKRVIKNVNQILDSELFHVELCKIQSFDFTNINGKVISDIFKIPPTRATVRFYKGWFWSRVNAYTNGGSIMYLNTRHLARSEASIANTIVHETVHIYDFFNNKHSFGHGDNRSIGKEKSAPYFIGSLIEEIYLRLYQV